MATLSLLTPAVAGWMGGLQVGSSKTKTDDQAVAGSLGAVGMAADFPGEFDEAAEDAAGLVNECPLRNHRTSSCPACQVYLIAHLTQDSYFHLNSC